MRREGAGGPSVLGDLSDLRREIQGEVLSHFRGEELALFPPLGRIGRAEEVARAILFFASPDADYIKGQTLSVNGGLTML